jgi:predicted ABC-type exoprotein transport system permease subunit
MRIVLACTLLIVAIYQIADWIKEIPALGYPLFIILLAVWLYEINKEIQTRRR